MDFSNFSSSPKLINNYGKAMSFFCLTNNQRLMAQFPNIDRYPSEKYYTLDEKLTENERPKIRTKREEKKEEKEEKKGKTTKKSIPFILNQNGKNVFEFLLYRFLYEMTKVYSENDDDVRTQQGLLELVEAKQGELDYCLSHLILCIAVNGNMRAIISDNFKMDELLRPVFIDEEMSFPIYIVKELVKAFIDFSKMISFQLSNILWTDTSSSVNEKKLITILLNLAPLSDIYMLNSNRCIDGVYNYLQHRQMASKSKPKKSSAGRKEKIPKKIKPKREAVTSDVDDLPKAIRKPRRKIVESSGTESETEKPKRRVPKKVKASEVEKPKVAKKGKKEIPKRKIPEQEISDDEIEETFKNIVPTRDGLEDILYDDEDDDFHTANDFQDEDDEDFDLDEDLPEDED